MNIRQLPIKQCVEKLHNFIYSVIMEKIQKIITRCLEEAPCNAEISYDEPMSAHTSFRTGGPAECLVKPIGADSFVFAVKLINAARQEQIPVFILGAGANILVSDKGISGITIDTVGWSGEIRGNRETELIFQCGTALDEAAELAASRGLGGLEFLAGMPGSIGGGLWMNARAYECEISDVVTEARILDYSSAIKIRTIKTRKKDFGYKHSPFQKHQWLILCARFSLHPRNENEIRSDMEKFRQDRQEKGHYKFPSAGSAFKNNRSFGKATGQIIDELGLKGLVLGGAQIAPYHANIIINTGGAAAKDIRDLMELAAAHVKEAYGFILEPEIIFAGDWDS